MTHKLKSETFSQKIEHSSGVILLPLTPLFSLSATNSNHILAKRVSLSPLFLDKNMMAIKSEQTTPSTAQQPSLEK